jgi:protein CLEC16A
VENEKMLSFILDRTAVPYFSNLVWFIGNKSVVLDDKILTTQRWVAFFLSFYVSLSITMPSFSSVMTRGRLEDLVAEHYDNLYYLNDIFSLEVHSVNNVLEAQVLKKFLIPLYVHSLVPEKTDSEVHSSSSFSY